MKVNTSDFNEEQEDIIEAIGIDNYIKLLKLRGGTYVYFQRYECAIREARNREIVRRFNGFNAQSLAYEYRLTEKHVKRILKKEGVL